MDSKTYVREKIIEADTLNSFPVDIIDNNVPPVEQTLVDFNLRQVTKNQTGYHFWTCSLD